MLIGLPHHWSGVDGVGLTRSRATTCALLVPHHVVLHHVVLHHVYSRAWSAAIVSAESATSRATGSSDVLGKAAALLVCDQGALRWCFIPFGSTDSWRHSTCSLDIANPGIDLQ